MVISALMQLAIAAPTGALFGAAYGTAIRIGYEIIFPALFGNKPTSLSVDETLKKMETLYTGVGGLEAQAFGVNTGVKNALQAMNADPELMELIKKNSSQDILNITVNQSGTSTPPVSELSPPFPSSTPIDLTGKAELHRRLREKVETALISKNQALIGNLFYEVEALAGTMPNINVSQIVKQLKTFWFNVTWFWGTLPLSLQKDLANRFNTQTSTGGKTSVAEEALKIYNLATLKGRAGRDQWFKMQQRISDWAKQFNKIPTKSNIMTIFRIKGSDQSIFFKYNNTVKKLANLSTRASTHTRLALQAAVKALIPKMKLIGWSKYYIWLDVGQGRLI